MAPPLRAFAYLTIRRSQRFRPHSIPQSLLPPLFWRAITVQAQEPNPSIDLPGTPDIQFAEAPNFSLPSSSGSQHPFAGRQISPFLSDPSSSRSVVTTLPFPPEKVASAPHIQHPFDTHAFVSYLEKADLGRETSRTLMESVRLLITKRGDKTRDDMVGKEDMENAAYLFRAALSELRNELSVRARNDGIAVRALIGAIRREVEGLEQKMKEDIQTLKHDIEIDMNNRKSETRTDMTGFDISTEEINNKFTILLGDLRTEIETAKWDSARRAISTIVLVVVCGIATSIYTSPPQPKQSLRPMSTPTRDMAIGSDDELTDDNDPETETVETLEKLLSDSGVGRVEFPTKKSRTKDIRLQGKETQDVNRRRI